MAVENAQFIADLNNNYPSGIDFISEGDNQIRLIKTVLQNTFSGFNGAVLYFCGISTNNGNYYNVSSSYNLNDYSNGMTIIFFVNSQNSGASYLRINSLQFIPIKTLKGETLIGGELKNNQLCMVVYYNGNFYLINSDKDYDLIESRYQSATNLTESRYQSSTNLTLYLFNEILNVGFEGWVNLLYINTSAMMNNIR